MPSRFPTEDKCDVCGKLVIRSDDTKETLAKRIETYKQNAKPILEFYKNKGILLTLDAAGKLKIYLVYYNKKEMNNNDKYKD